MDISSASPESLGQNLQTAFLYLRSYADRKNYNIKGLQIYMNYFRDALDFELESRGNDSSEEGDEDLEQLIRSICYQSPGVPRKPNELLPTDLIKAIKDSKNVMYFLLYYCNRELSRVNHPLNHLLKWYVSEKLLRTSKPSVIDMYVSSR